MAPIFLSIFGLYRKTELSWRYSCSVIPHSCIDQHFNNIMEMILISGKLALCQLLPASPGSTTNDNDLHTLSHSGGGFKYQVFVPFS